MGQIETQIYFNEIPFEHEFQIVQDKFSISNDGILGNDFLMKYGATINYGRDEIILRVPQRNENKDEQTVIDLQSEKQMNSEHSGSSKKGNKNKNYFKYNDVLVKPSTRIISLNTINLENDDTFERTVNDENALKMASMITASDKAK